MVAFAYFLWIALVPGGLCWLLDVCNRSLFMVVTGYWFLLVRGSSFLLLAVLVVSVLWLFWLLLVV